MQRKVSHNPTGSDFIYLPKEWYNRQLETGWDGKTVNISGTSRLIIDPSQSNGRFIISRTPLRLPLGGGGSDLPEYYSKHGGGLWVSAAISSFISVVLKPRFENQSKFVYSETQYVDNPAQFNHPILKAVFSKYNLAEHIELVSLADLPSNLGLGSSGAFTVGLLNAIHAFLKIDSNAKAVAEEAFEVERNILGRKTGKQDQYASSIGGFNVFACDVSGNVTYSPLKNRGLDMWLSLFYVGRRSGSAEEALAAISDDDREATAKIGLKCVEALRDSDYNEYGNLVDLHWGIKRKSQPDRFDYIIREAKAAGALGGKLCGAGGSGCILLVCPPERRFNVMEAMKAMRLIHIPFKFDMFGGEVY